ncbi:hypothetical protein M407DRAFT_245450 [Tulasnella calospora MUT 4182]|uniref:Uncharacterized protein n=1 Tax=Tulasnella calospora MUT 4182 TaxID=1051891 RepID=A0A0C3QB76_9AGAM|nr:hypothetical protein M407DRAFT_245450 [Tulasnella calospora MUT 4182]
MSRPRRHRPPTAGQQRAEDDEASRSPQFFATAVQFSPFLFCLVQVCIWLKGLERKWFWG